MRHSFIINCWSKEPERSCHVPLLRYWLECVPWRPKLAAPFGKQLPFHSPICINCTSVLGDSRRFTFISIIWRDPPQTHQGVLMFSITWAPLNICVKMLGKECNLCSARLSCRQNRAGARRRKLWGQTERKKMNRWCLFANITHKDGPKVLQAGSTCLDLWGEFGGARVAASTVKPPLYKTVFCCLIQACAWYCNWLVKGSFYPNLEKKKNITPKNLPLCWAVQLHPNSIRV